MKIMKTKAAVDYNRLLTIPAGLTPGEQVAMPSYKAGSGEYKGICFPVTKEFREQLNQAVFQAYDLVLTQNHEQNQRKVEMPTSDQMPEQNTGIHMAGL